MIRREQFDQLYHATYRQLRLYLDRITDGAGEVDDITQESFIRLLSSAPAHLTESQFRSYLFSTATNIVRDRWRRGKIVGEWAPLDESIAADDATLVELPARLDLTRVLGRMSIMQRSLVWLAYAEGCTHQEIAEVLKVQEASVRVLLFRAKKRFIALYDEMESSEKKAE